MQLSCVCVIEAVNYKAQALLTRSFVAALDIECLLNYMYLGVKHGASERML